MKHWKSILGIGFIFLFGVATGGLLTARVIDKRIRDLLRGGPDAVENLVETRLTRELHLDPQQRAGVVKAITSARLRLREARNKVQPEVDGAFSQAELEIRSLLRPEQVARFDRVVSRTKGRWQR